MNYKVLIKQCDSPMRAVAIAGEAARGSGVAEPMDDGDDGENESGRILTEDEFMERLNVRKDIFTIEKDDRLRRIEAACLVAGIASGLWLTKHEMATVVAPDFYDTTTKEFTARLIDSKEVTAPPRPKNPEPKIKNIAKTSDTKSIKKDRSTGSGGTNGGGGDPRERVTRMGVLGLISGKVAGKSVASADIFGQGGFATNIDAIIQGTNGLKQGGGGGMGRKGMAGIGYGIGINSGMGGGGDLNVDDLIGSLLPSAADFRLAQPEFKRDRLTFNEPAITPGHGVMIGGRNRAGIMRVVMQNLAALRYAYNKRLREKPELKGKITCKFIIDEFGKVVFCEMTGSTIFDPSLEAEVVTKIRAWVFEKIDKPGDMTEVVYPFAFSQ
jgi:hypothetical protein